MNAGDLSLWVGLGVAMLLIIVAFLNDPDDWSSP